MMRKNTPTAIQTLGFAWGKRIIKGRRRTISTSKIRKITAIKKNRRENGSREDLFGSNPHSKGELFSRSTIDFLESRAASIIIMVVMMIRVTPSEVINKIIYFELIQTF
jgi:hypothetical protein